MDEKIKILVYNLMCDLKKKEVDNFDRAELILEYAEATGKSIREIGRDIGVPQSTISSWVRWAKISREEYDNYIKQGYVDTDIKRALHTGVLEGTPPIDAALEHCIDKLQPFKLGLPKKSKDTVNLLRRLKLVLKSIEEHV